MSRWLELYSAVARQNGGEPDAGRRLRDWALQAGFSRVDSSASAFCADSPETCRWWSDLWAERTTSSALGQRALELGLSTPEELAKIAAGWRRWAEDPGAWLGFLHGEIIAHP
jgi:hypothetical protein